MSRFIQGFILSRGGRIVPGRPLADRSVNPCQAVGVNPGPIQHLHSQPAGDRPGEAAPFEAPRRSGQRAIEVYEAAALLESLDEVEVLEDGIRLEAADRFI